MKWNDAKLGLKLALGFGLVLGLMGLVALVATLSSDGTRDHVIALEEINEHLTTLKNREVDHHQWALEVSLGILKSNPLDVQVEMDPRNCSFGRWYYGEDRRELEAHMPSLVEPLSRIEPVHNAFHESFGKIRELYRQRGAAAKDQMSTIFEEDTLARLREFKRLVMDIDSTLSDRVESIKQETIDMANAASWKIRWLTLAAFVLGLLMAFFISRGITRPLARVVEAAHAIAEGDLSPRELDDKRQDEIGNLARAFGGMTVSLRKVAAVMDGIAQGRLKDDFAPKSERDAMGASLRMMLDNLWEMSVQVNKAVQVVTSSIAQLSATTSEMSSSAAETAVSINETTSTVEEVKQTATLSSQKAKHVAETSHRAMQVSQAGNKSIEDINRAMGQIREKMDFIAQRIVNLSEKAQTISDIVAAVNDLTDQSNILAVNASIEAAKAGEEGRGFAVVAREIRNLAEQSKQSTNQIKGILDDIQKATSSAVMVTEQGSRAVADGEKCATEAGEAIRQLSTSVADASRAATQIVASSNEELVGMEQVAQAMENIRQAGDQNSQSASQLESALRELNDLGRQLESHIQRYKL